MRLLLDTHTFLWFTGGQTSLLSATALDHIQNPDNELWFSFGSVWELSIKSSTGKLKLTKRLEPFILEHTQRNRILLLPTSLSHLARVEILPLHHRDPFDRLLVAQSLAENLPLVSVDKVLDAYGIQRVW